MGNANSRTGVADKTQIEIAEINVAGLIEAARIKGELDAAGNAESSRIQRNGAFVLATATTIYYFSRFAVQASSDGYLIQSYLTEKNEMMKEYLADLLKDRKIVPALLDRNQLLSIKQISMSSNARHFIFLAGASTTGMIVAEAFHLWPRRHEAVAWLQTMPFGVKPAATTPTPAATTPTPAATTPTPAATTPAATK